ncbi:hypothetical protein J0676_27895, partial [Vibrio sp. Vb2880]
IEREKPQQEDATLKKAEHKGKMIQLVEQGRKLLISIFEDVLRLNDDSIRIGKVVMMELSIQEFQHVVAQGILTNDFESKMKAAL